MSACAGEEERSQFLAYHETYPDITEQALIEHEAEVAKLNQRRESTEPLLKRIDNYQQLLDERDRYSRERTARRTQNMHYPPISRMTSRCVRSRADRSGSAGQCA